MLKVMDVFKLFQFNICTSIGTNKSSFTKPPHLFDSTAVQC